MLNSNYNWKEYETQSLDTKCEVCGGTREALAIRRGVRANAGVSNELQFLTNCISLPNSPTPSLTLNGAHGLHVKNYTTVQHFRVAALWMALKF